MDDNDLALAALLDFLDAVEAGAASAKQRIKEAKLETPANQDFNKLQWETKTGAKGPFQQASNDGSTLFQALQRQLKEHGSFWKHRGFSYWNHNQNTDVIDRRRT